MYSRLPTTLLFLCSLATASMAAEQPPALLFVPPLDTAVVKVDSNLSTTALSGGKAARRGPSPAALVAQQFYPRFGAAFALAARRVEVIDSSSAAGAGLPAPDAPDYLLAIGTLSFAQTSKTVARHFVPPSPPTFDPATGQMTPGLHRGYSEGPGIVTTLTATALWTLRDLRKGANDSALAYGTSEGSSSFRGEARKSHWDEAARELAKAILYQTRFAPPR